MAARVAGDHAYPARRSAAGTGWRDPRVAIERFNFEDGVIGQAPFIRPLPSLHAAPDGRIWYHTDSTIGWIDPRNVQRNARVPPVRLRALAIDGVVHPVRRRHARNTVKSLPLAVA